MNNITKVDYDNKTHILFLWVATNAPVLVEIKEQQRIFELREKYKEIENIPEEETIKITKLKIDTNLKAWTLSSEATAPIKELKTQFVKL